MTKSGGGDNPPRSKFYVIYTHAQNVCIWFWLLTVHKIPTITCRMANVHTQCAVKTVWWRVMLRQRLSWQQMIILPAPTC